VAAAIRAAPAVGRLPMDLRQAADASAILIGLRGCAHGLGVLDEVTELGIVRLAEGLVQRDAELLLSAGTLLGQMGCWVGGVRLLSVAHAPDPGVNVPRAR
jgi:hypothetical protein